MNGFACGTQYTRYWGFNSCEGLALQLDAQRKRLLTHYDPFESLLYHQLKQQYAECLTRYGLGFAGLDLYTYRDLGLLDVP